MAYVDMTPIEFVDRETLEQCPTRDNVLCTITDKDHRHIAKHMVWWICKECGFNAKEFEPRVEKQVGAMKWHKAFHEKEKENNGHSDV